MVKKTEALNAQPPGKYEMQKIIFFAGIAVSLLAAQLLAESAAGPQGRLLDAMDKAGGWEIVASDGVKLSLAAERDADGSPVMRLDYDFASGAGYAGIRRKWAGGEFKLPENYAFSFMVKGRLPLNNLEFKLLDPSGDNVWWVNRRSFEFKKNWERLFYRKRHIGFAWGPSSAPLQEVSGLEFVVSSVNGGRGSVWLRDLRFYDLPPARTFNEEPLPEAGTGELTLDLRHDREFGGVAITWRDPGDTKTRLPSRALVEISDGPPGSGSSWRTAAELDGPLQDRSFVALPDSSGRALRVRALDSAGQPSSLPAKVDVRDLAFSSTPNAFAKAVAAEYRKGVFPKAILGQVQSDWTVLGVSGDEPEILLNEEGQIELSKGGPSLEPFVRLEGRLLTWADGVNVPGLQDGYLPIGRVERKYSGYPLELSVTALVEGEPGAAVAWARYRLKNAGDRPLSPELIVAVRPFQVLPPWQELNITGGVSKVGRIRFAEGRVEAGQIALQLLPAPPVFMASSPAQGDLVALIDAGRAPAASGADCPDNSASGAGLWPMTLKPGESRDVVVAWPLGKYSAD